MLPESILHSGPMTHRGPGFNVTMGTRNDDEGDGLSGGHGRRMVNINMFTSPQTATQASTDVKSGGLQAFLTNIRNAPEGPTKPVPEAPQAQMGQQGGGIFSGAKSLFGNGGGIFGFGTGTASSSTQPSGGVTVTAGNPSGGGNGLLSSEMEIGSPGYQGGGCSLGQR